MRWIGCMVAVVVMALAGAATSAAHGEDAGEGGTGIVFVHGDGHRHSFDCGHDAAPGGCNAYGCWESGGGCNAYGCWNTPSGSCNAYGCSEIAPCNAYGCPPAESRPATIACWKYGARIPANPAGCSAYGCWDAGGGCNAYGCWSDGGGCNAYGCWNSPIGACNAYGCSERGACSAYGCPPSAGRGARVVCRAE